MAGEQLYPFNYHGFTPSSCTETIETKIGKREKRLVNEDLEYYRTVQEQNIPDFTSEYMEEYYRKQAAQRLLLKKKAMEAENRRATMTNPEYQPDSALAALMAQEGNQLPHTASGPSGSDNALAHPSLEDYDDDTSSTGSNDGLTQTRRLARQDGKGGYVAPSNRSLNHSGFQTSYVSNFHGNPIKRLHKSSAKRKFQASTDRVKFLGRGLENTTYRRDVGPTLTNPRKRLGNLHDVEDIATTRELAEGSTKATAHVPGYTGHVPVNEFNKKKMHDKRADYKKMGARDQLKMNMLQNIPGYAGYLPTAERNYMDRSVSTGHNTEATSTFVEKPVELGIAHDHGISAKCMQDFFVLAANTSSDGMASAQKFFATTRPLEGMIKLK